VSCAANRDQHPKCDCKDGYYPSGEACNKCAYKCKTCLGVETNCTKCASNRDPIPDCICPKGYYEVEGEVNCRSCHETCETCTSADECTSCKPKYYLHNGKCE